MSIVIFFLKNFWGNIPERGKFYFIWYIKIKLEQLIIYYIVYKFKIKNNYILNEYPKNKFY